MFFRFCYLNTLLCRWPSHLQVVCPAIRFIEYTPPIPAPMYEPTGREPTPAVRGPQMGEVIPLGKLMNCVL